MFRVRWLYATGTFGPVRTLCDVLLIVDAVPSLYNAGTVADKVKTVV